MSRAASLKITALPDFPLVKAGDDLAGLIAASVARSRMKLEDGDVVVVAQKIVSKAEGRVVDLASIKPSDRASALAVDAGKDPRLVEVILSESRRVVRCSRNVLIVEHRLGFVMANAGVDRSNVGPDDGVERVLLLPEDPDLSAEAVRTGLQARCRARVAIIINDSFGRPWRRGTVGVAIGTAGLPALADKRGEPDLFGRTLRVTVIGFADEIAAAASLLMGQAGEGRPVVVMRGLQWTAQATSSAELIRPEAEDLFR